MRRILLEKINLLYVVNMNELYRVCIHKMATYGHFYLFQKRKLMFIKIKFSLKLKMKQLNLKRYQSYTGFLNIYLLGARVWFTNIQN